LKVGIVAAPAASSSLISHTSQGRLPRYVTTRRVELGVTVVLTDQVAAAVLDAATAKLELRVPLVWVSHPTTVRAEVVLHNAHGLPVRLGMQIIRDKPWKITVYLMIYGEHVRRLDVNGSHRNRTDGEVWTHRTHKHRFSEAHQDAEAYAPSNIPAVSFQNVSGEDYRRVLEAFCDECGITLGGTYAWQAPSLGPPAAGGLGSGGAA
jgi:hypothetical protein